MSALDNLIEDARARGVRDIDDLPKPQSTSMLAMAVSIIDGDDALAGVDIPALVAEAITAGTLDEAVRRHGAVSWAVYRAYKAAATRYINEELNNGK